MRSTTITENFVNSNTTMDRRYILDTSMRDMVLFMRDLILNKSEYTREEGYHFPKLNEFDEEALLGYYLKWLSQDCPFEFLHGDDSADLQKEFASALITGDSDLISDFIEDAKKAAKNSYMENIYLLLDDQAQELSTDDRLARRSA